MLSGIRKRVTYTNVAMTLALVFAMTGGAYAASKVLITSTKQIKPSVLAQLKGKAGANGTPGAQGPAGVAGAQGPAGPQGAAGAVGAEGPAGPVGATGPKGANGKNGEPWTPNNTLPVGATETGAWSFGSINSTATSSSPLWVPIASFTVQLASPLTKSQVHFINKENKEVVETEAGELEEKASTACTGSAEAPTAESGNLCVYGGFEMETLTTSNEIKNPDHLGSPGAGKTGAVEAFLIKANSFATGTWAVTG
jgi:hypothetical protein